MKCESCDLETQTGKMYAFYYGGTTGTTYTGKSIITNYHIAGQQNLFLCDICVARQSEKSARILGLMFLVIPLLIGGVCFLSTILLNARSYQGSFLSIMWAALFAPLVYLLRRSIWKRDGGGVGDSLAIKLRKSGLKQAGFDSFFTREQYKRMGGRV